MTTETPGYRLTIRAFVAADPDQPGQMARAAAMVDSLAEQLERMGLHGATVEPRFVSRHRLPSSPPAASPAVPAPTLEATPQAAAEPADAAAASIDYQAARADAVASGGPHGADAQAPEVSGSGGHDCAHKNQKRYGNGTVVCLDCQAAVTTGEAA